MKWFLNLKTGLKMVSGFIIISLMIGVVGYIGISNMKQINTHLETLAKENLEKTRIVADIQANTLRNSTIIHMILISNDQNEMKQLKEQIEQLVIRNNELYDGFIKGKIDPKEKNAG